MRCLLTALLACIAVLGLTACDYPEQGYFALVGVDEDGGRVAYLPFMVDELTDDSHMTIGFTLLLPRFGQLVEIPLQNGEDLSRRYWQLEIADSDSEAGNLALELEHADERLSLTGLYQQASGAPVQRVAGYMVPTVSGISQLVFSSDKPQVPAALDDVLYFEIHPIERKQFEDYLGTAVEKAKRVAAAQMPELGAPDGEAADAAVPPVDERREEEPTRQPPKLGGRK